jgi:hypothetical protein
MPQKTLFKNKKGKKKDIAINLHGKTGLTKRGRQQKVPQNRMDIPQGNLAYEDAL